MSGQITTYTLQVLNRELERPRAAEHVDREDRSRLVAGDQRVSTLPNRSVGAISAAMSCTAVRRTPCWSS